MIRPSLPFAKLFSIGCALVGILLFASRVAAVTFEKRVAASADDAEEFTSDGSIYITSTDLELIHDTTDQVVGMRWTGVTIPPGATITAAYVQFTAKETQSELTNLFFNGQAADNPAGFTSTHLSISTRPRTAAQVAWSNVPAWASSDGATAKQQTPSLVPIIQEIVNRPGWASGNSMVVVVTGSGHRCAYAFDAGTATKTALLHVEYTTAPVNNAPVARLTLTQPATPPLTVNADGSTSTDTDAFPIASYRFDFGDGTPTVTANAPSTTASHAYTAPGIYTVTLVATDTGNLSSSPATRSITIQAENPPVAQLAVTQPATPPLTVNASAAGSTDGDPTPIASYQFDFGDGTPTVTATAPSVTASHAYAAAGPYTVSLIAVDTGGNASSPVTKSITVQPENPPTAALTVSQLASPALTVGADGSGSSDADLTPIASYRFNFGDGTPTVTANVPSATASHTYSAPGSYTVSLVVLDTGGNASAPVTQGIDVVPQDDPPVAQLAVSQPATPPLTVNADGSASTDGDLTPIATYAFDFGDGTPTVTASAPSATASHAYGVAGSYTVTLVATDTGGKASAPVTRSIAVQGEGAPVAHLSLSQPATPPLTVVASGATSTDGDLTPIASYSFDFGDGTIITTTAPTATATHAYGTADSHTVTLTVTDTGGNVSAPVSETIFVQAEEAPIAALVVSQASSPFLTALADGSSSTDGDLTPIASYRFDFGDGSATVTATAPTATAKHTYSSAGNYSVTLIAIDTAGNPSEPVTEGVTINAPPEAPPVARLSVTRAATPELKVDADGSASTDDTDLTPIASYAFDFGDGTPTVTAIAPSATASHTYTTMGTYTVTLIVTDTDGFHSTPVTQSITVQPPDDPPVAHLTVSQPPTPALTVNADGSTSTDVDFTPIATYRFNFGDGTPTVTATAPSATASHTYASPGAYTVVLVVSDTGGNASAPVSQSITVQAEAPPVARLTVNQPPTPALTVNADGSTSTDGDLTPIATYRFTWGDGTATTTATAPTSTASHAYAAPGNYTVTLIAVDTGGNASPPASQSITVQGDAPPVARLTVTQPATPPLTVNASGSTSTDTDLTPIATYRFTWGDGTPTTTATAPTSTATHTYAAAGTYTVTLIAVDTANLSSAPVAASVTLSTTPTPVDKRVTASSDDAEQSSTGTVTLTSSDLELIHDSSDQIVGIRWTGINVPRNATINNAYIQFGAKESQSETTTLTIRGEAADNSATYTTTTGNITARTRTSSYVTWSPVAWNSTDGQGTNQRTPNLAFPIQQIVNRTGWVSGNALSIIINGIGHRTAWAFDGSATNCPLLHIDYNNGPPPPQQAPVGRLSVAAVGLTANADGSASTDGDLTPIASYRFNFGDGTAAVVVNAPSATASHTYANAGTYTVTLTCTDTGGLTSAPATQSVTVSGGTGGGGSGVAVYVGYYDTHHTDQPKPKPSIWQGSSNTVFVGAVDPGTTNGWDTSAIRIDNLGTSALTGVSVTADMGSHHFALWSAQSIPAGAHLILAQTTLENFDGSDTNPAGCFSCDPNDCLTKVTSTVPVVHVTIGGTTTNYPDPGQIMNTHGVDQAGCPYTGTRNDESSDWVRVFPQTGAPSARTEDGEVTGQGLSWVIKPFPNPNHGVVHMRFRTAYRGHFELGIYDILGRLQKSLSEPDLEPGDYLETASLDGLKAGMYYFTVTTPQGSLRHPFALVR